MDSGPKVVFWDLGVVILRTEDQVPRRAWEERLGLAPGELARTVFDGPVALEAMLGRATADDVWRSVQTALKLSARDRDQLRSDFFRGDRIDEDLMTFLRGLRVRLRVGLISNAWPEVRRLLENTWRIAADFDPLILSAEVGLVKPDVSIFRQALIQAAALPTQAIFVDDFQQNTDAAAALGMRAVLFRTPGQAREDILRHLGGE